MKKQLSVSDKHQLVIAKQTLQMSDIFVRIMGGMTKEEAKIIINCEPTGRGKEEK